MIYISAILTILVIIILVGSIVLTMIYDKGLIFIIGVMLIAILMNVALHIDNNTHNVACQDLNLEDYKTINGVDYCEDIDGNLYTVNLDCGWKDCTARRIKIYD